MSAPPQNDIVHLFPPPGPRRLLGLWKSKTRVPAQVAGCELFAIHSSGDGAAPRIARLDARSLADPPADALVAQVCIQPQPAVLAFPRALSDEAGHAWDLIMTGTWAIADAAQFLSVHALSQTTLHTPLSRERMEAFLTDHIADRARDALRPHTLENLRDHDALPARWWEKRLAEWLAPYALAVKITAARWTSADAARAQADEQRRLETQRQRKQSERERQADLQRLAAEAQYQSQRQKLEADQKLSETQRTHELERLERRHRTDILQEEQAFERLRRQGEAEALEHQLKLAQIRHDIASVETAKARQAAADARHQEIVDQLASAKKELERLAKLSEPLLQKLSAAPDAAAAFQTAERLTSPEFAVAPETLDALGFNVSRQSLIDALKRKHAAVPTVTLRKEELLTRDIGAAKIKALPIGSSLQFSFTSARPGHATVLNIGTSGTVWLQVPNIFIAAPHALRTIAARKLYNIPGPDLFPWDGDYREEGPPGWEHLAVIISDVPLITPETLLRSTEDSPFVALTASELAGLHQKLATQSADTWSAGALSFLVG